MEMNNIFEVATREKFRFPYHGMISVEDLWELSAQNLDSVFKALNSQVKQAKEESLLSTKTHEDSVLEQKIDIVKHVVAVKLAEAEKRKKAKEISDKKKQIMAIIADKQDEELHGKSVAELQAMLDAM